MSHETVTAAGISFTLTPERRGLQELAHEFVAHELRPIAAEWDAKDDFPPDLLARAARLGLTSYRIPREYGGAEVDAVTAAIVAEELSWGCAGLAATIGATMFPVRPLTRFGSDEQRQRYLPRLASEEAAWPRSPSPSRTPAPTSTRSARPPDGTGTPGCSPARSATSRTAVSPS